MASLSFILFCCFSVFRLVLSFLQCFLPFYFDSALYFFCFFLCYCCLPFSIVKSANKKKKNISRRLFNTGQCRRDSLIFILLRSILLLFFADAIHYRKAIAASLSIDPNRMVQSIQKQQKCREVKKLNKIQWLNKTFCGVLLLKTRKKLKKNIIHLSFVQALESFNFVYAWALSNRYGMLIILLFSFRLTFFHGGPILP